MKGVKFKHQNTVFAENQDEYQSLPALVLNDAHGNVVTCWRPTFVERLKILFLGRVWMNLLTFNQPLTPAYLTAHRKEVFSIEEDKLSFIQKIKKILK